MVSRCYERGAEDSVVGLGIGVNGINISRTEATSAAGTKALT